MPSDEELARVPLPSIPQLDALPSTARSQGLDLAAIAEGFSASDANTPVPLRAADGPSLLVFVSFAMPRASLEKLLALASRAGATMVLRGLVGDSLRETARRIQELEGGAETGFQIDPQAFDRFAISATPSYVLVKDGTTPKPCAAGTCFDADAFVAVPGDVSLTYALEQIRARVPGFAAQAEFYLQRLRAPS